MRKIYVTTYTNISIVTRIQKIEINEFISNMAYKSKVDFEYKNPFSYKTF